ncbi:VacJ family lipoprotein [Gammaproteobacteria bacterium]|nr:VacJ family lipoprotein [Gammaproteobacteria bacterium]
MKNTLFLLFLSFVLSIFLAPVSLAQDDDDFFIFDEEEEEIKEVADPLEPFNRAMFTFNDKLYRGVLKPVAIGYRRVPEPARISVSNFLDNLETPVSSVNALVQLDIKNAVTESSRFLINSTIGLFGLFDPATKMGLERETEDLGQTLGRYGVGHGFYLVLPLSGPSSLRDGISRVGNNIRANPMLDDLSNGDFIVLRLIDAETALSLDQDSYEAFYESALDPYIFFRSSYIQRRDAQVAQ